MKTKALSISKEGIREASDILRSGGLVAFPTETVYGLGADATNDSAVAKIFAAKARPTFNPLIVHVASLAAAGEIVELSGNARVLAEAFWPGALTLVAPLKPGSPISKLVTAGGELCAVRVPDHPVGHALLTEVGKPIAAPSANPSGRISPTTPEHVLAGLDGRIDAVIDGEQCQVGLESTIVGLLPEPTLLRAGGIPAEAIEACLGTKLATLTATDNPIAPGQLASHYAPSGDIRIDADTANDDEYMIGFGSIDGDVNLSPSGDLTEAAANLFSFLHAADATGKKIAVAPIPDTGLGRAINDRLIRAAAPRV